MKKRIIFIISIIPIIFIFSNCQTDYYDFENFNKKTVNKHTFYYSKYISTKDLERIIIGVSNSNCIKNVNHTFYITKPLGRHIEIYVVTDITANLDQSFSMATLLIVKVEITSKFHYDRKPALYFIQSDLDINKRYEIKIENYHPQRYDPELDAKKNYYKYLYDSTH